MVSAGNTGATMASALLRMGRIKGVARPAIATPIPVPGGTPTVLLDAGANAECQPEWLVQFAQMGAVYARRRFGVERPRVGAAVASARRPGRASPLVKETFGLLAAERGARRRRRRLRRQRRGSRPDDRRRRRGRHRRLHRQRGAQDARGRPEGHRRRICYVAFASTDEATGRGRRAAARRSRRCPTSSIPTRRAGRCCWASRASASSATARRARRRSSTRSQWPRRWSSATWSAACADAVAG